MTHPTTLTPLDRPAPNGGQWLLSVAQPGESPADAVRRLAQDSTLAFGMVAASWTVAPYTWWPTVAVSRSVALEWVTDNDTAADLDVGRVAVAPVQMLYVWHPTPLQRALGAARRAERANPCDATRAGTRQAWDACYPGRWSGDGRGPLVPADADATSPAAGRLTE